MNHDTLRDLIRARIAALGITTHHAARLAGLPDQTVRDYLSGGDLASRRVLVLAGAVGIAVSAAPVEGFAPAPPATGGRPKTIPGNP